MLFFDSLEEMGFRIFITFTYSVFQAVLVPNSKHVFTTITAFWWSP